MSKTISKPPVMPGSAPAAAGAAGRNRRAVALWLFVCCAMIFAMVILGGVTRLTESGLSITEWRPVTGAIPPLSEADWLAEFAKYQQIPEFQQINRDMTLAEFKFIFWMEYAHRLWGRLIGLAFLLPFLWFAATGRLAPGLAPRLILLFVLGGLQGAVGWYMVKSGLSDRVDVSPYRLVAHLGLAVAIYGYALWLALGLRWPRGGGTALRRAGLAFAVYVFVLMMSGGFVAGHDAGRTYNTFPLMDGHLVPPGYFDLSPWWLNPFENVAAIQFNHRLLGMGAIYLAALLWVFSRRAASPVWGLGLAVVVTAGLQMSLGIVTLLLAVPVWLGALHQAGAMVLLTLLIAYAHAAGGPAAAVTPARAPATRR